MRSLYLILLCLSSFAYNPGTLTEVDKQNTALTLVNEWDVNRAQTITSLILLFSFITVPNSSYIVVICYFISFLHSHVAEKLVTLLGILYK